MRVYLFIIFMMLSASLVYADDIEVPWDYLTISEAITVAVDGDVILVDKGTYCEDLDFQGKKITITGISGPFYTIIQGTGLGSVVKFVSEEGSDSILEGFTIENGIGTSTASGLLGGGIYCDNTSPSLDSLVIESNTAARGAGIYSTGGTLDMVNSQVCENKADTAGGGVYLASGQMNLTDCVIRDNTAVTSDGGGIYCSMSDSISLTRTVLLGNECASWGGGMPGIFNQAYVIRDSVIALNKAGISGGGIGLFYEGNLDIINVTFFENSATIGKGGGFMLNLVTPVNAVNTIMWGDTAPTGPEGMLENSTMDIDFCNVEGGSSTILVSSGTLNYGANNISAAPLFADVANGDFHLLSESGGLDLGDNTALGLGLSGLDLEGNDRIENGVVDIGADEYILAYIYFTGVTVEGGAVTLNLIGDPYAAPVTLFLGSGILDAPIPTQYGDWWLKFPIHKTIAFLPLPADGYMAYTGTVPWGHGFPHGTAFPFQCLIGDKASPPAFLVLE